jgi:DNA invertase Pin-like site-specific DNA recombinase
MSRRRQHRRAERARRHAQPPWSTENPAAANPVRVVVREASHVERLAYTRSQAAQALGVSRSTFIRRVLPYIETLDMPWGGKLIPVDELERLVAERRRAARARTESATRGRPPAVAAEVVARVRAARAEGKSLRRIASELNADDVPTAHGGARWWPSTVRAILHRWPEC